MHIQIKSSYLVEQVYRKVNECHRIHSKRIGEDSCGFYSQPPQLKKTYNIERRKLVIKDKTHVPFEIQVMELLVAHKNVT